MTQIAYGSSSVCLRIANVAGPRRFVYRRNADVFKLLKEIPGLIDCYAPAVARVVELARYRGGHRRLQIEIDHVLHIREVPRLFSIPIDDRRTPFEHSFDEQREHARILA